MRMDEKLARISAGRYTRKDFLIADAKDPDMGPGLHAVGPNARQRRLGLAAAHPRGIPRLDRGGDPAGHRRHHADLGLQSRAAGRARRLPRLAASRRRSAPTTRPISGAIAARPTMAIRRGRSAPLRSRAPRRSPTSASIRSPSTTISTGMCVRSRRSRRSAPTRRRTTSTISWKCSIRTSLRHLRRGHAALRQRRHRARARRAHQSRAAAVPQDRLQRAARARRTRLLRSLPGRRRARRRRGHDARLFRAHHQAEKYGARVALFGRKINLAESPLDIVSFMRLVASGEISPSRGGARLS